MRRFGTVATWKKRLLALSFGLVVALILTEIGLRVLGISFQDFYRADPDRGVAHRPGASGWFRREGRQYITINRDGFRDRDHSRRKPPGTFRVAVLGDSYTEAFQVRREDAFPSVLEREMAKCPAFGGRSVEVLNFGVSNYGTAQELITLRQRVWDYSPDLILLAFFAGNDVWDNSRALRKDPEIPYYTLEGDRLVLDDSFRGSARQAAERSSFRVFLKGCIETIRVLQVVRQAWGVSRLKRGQRPSPALGATSSVDELGASWYQDPIYREPTDPVWQSAWEVTERLILEMRDEAARHRAGFAVVTLSTGIQVHPVPSVSEKARLRLGIPDLFHADRRVLALGEKEGFPVLNLAPTLRDFAVKEKVYLHGFGSEMGKGHWNEEGHRLAGQMIAGWLCDQETRRDPR